MKGKVISSSTIDILGRDIGTYRKWIEFQFTPELNWSNKDVDHVKSVCLFDISKDEEIRECFNWKNNQPSLKQDHQHKGTHINILVYWLQFIKTYHFFKIKRRAI